MRLGHLYGDARLFRQAKAGAEHSRVEHGEAQIYYWWEQKRPCGAFTHANVACA